MNGNTYKSKMHPNVTIKSSTMSEYGLFAKKEFSKGDIVYESTALIINVDEYPNELFLDCDNILYNIDKIIHPVPLINNLSILYGFDSFTNHSCEPNTACKPVEENDPCVYRCYALRDIRKDEELNCNYNSFYFLDAHPFDCKCGSVKCMKKIGGFLSLSHEQQKLMINDVEPYYFKIYNLEHLKDI